MEFNEHFRNTARLNKGGVIVQKFLSKKKYFETKKIRKHVYVFYMLKYMYLLSKFKANEDFPFDL